jgi:predicted O-methyltransferase YrrM
VKCTSSADRVPGAAVLTTTPGTGPFPVRLPRTGPGQARQQSEGVIDQGRTAAGKGAQARGAGPVEGSALSDWAAGWQPEEPPLLSARQRAAEVGVGAVDPFTGATLRLLAAAAGARTVIELGTGAGVSSLWLLAGMRPDGVLTTVDAESEHQRLAKASLAEAGFTGGRARLIHGRALEVLPRLSDGGYDLVFCDANRSENGDYLAAALRLLRPGGLVVFAGALGGGRIAESSARDAETVAQRELAKAVREEPRLVAGAVPVGAGLLVGALTG